MSLRPPGSPGQTPGTPIMFIAVNKAGHIMRVRSVQPYKTHRVVHIPRSVITPQVSGESVPKPLKVFMSAGPQLIPSGR